MTKLTTKLKRNKEFWSESQREMDGIICECLNKIIARQKKYYETKKAKAKEDENEN